MKTAVNWRPYILFAILFSIFVSVFNWKLGLGFIIGTVFNFINLFLIEKKFPKLESKERTISIALFTMLFQGLLTALMAIGTYFIGGLACFLAGFAGMIIPHFYFVILSLFKK